MERDLTFKKRNLMVKSKNTSGDVFSRHFLPNESGLIILSKSGLMCSYFHADMMHPKAFLQVVISFLLSLYFFLTFNFIWERVITGANPLKIQMQAD